MRYMGSKARLAKDITDKINNIALCEGITEYYEPFMGGCSVGELVDIKNRHLSDINSWMVELFKKIQSGIWDFKYVTREEWQAVKASAMAKDAKYPDWYYGWVGCGCSFRGRTFATYGGIYTDSDKNKEVNPQLQVYRSLCKEVDLVKDIEFTCRKYNEIGKPYHSIIYCDAPYRGTTQYIGADNFDFDAYDKWLIEMAKDNLVLISEYIMPYDNFDRIDTWNLSKSIGRGNTSDESSIENLYCVRGGWLTDKYFNDSAFDF
jgi:site-specific DNA-adenine methylase